MKYEHDYEVGNSARAASHVVGVLLKLLGPVQSIVDVGGGTGAWCQQFQSQGVSRVRCLDHVSAAGALLIDQKDFTAVDLFHDSPAPVLSEIAMSLEVGEHLPPHRADWLVDYLTQCASTVIFSAAVPGQGGHRHINEQWPVYWQERFQKRGYLQYDIVRPLIVREEEIPFWYRTNLFIYSRDAQRWANPTPFLPSTILPVHEHVLKNLQNPTLKQTLRRLPLAVAEFLRHRFHRN
ncbi:hypothetical protein BH11PLA2_BH11PLA2_12760 [soil metagenome]